MNNKKVNPNSKFIKIAILLIAIICMGIIFAIVWRKSNDLIISIAVLISILGILFNIYLSWRAKSKK